MLACISSEISTKLLGMPTHIDWPSLTAAGLYLMQTGHFCCPLSTDPLRQPSPTAFSGFLLPTISDRRSLAHFRSCRDLELRPLFGFAPKQTKRSSAWRTPFIVSQRVVCLFAMRVIWRIQLRHNHIGARVWSNQLDWAPPIT